MSCKMREIINYCFIFDELSKYCGELFFFFSLQYVVTKKECQFGWEFLQTNLKAQRVLQICVCLSVRV